jgi:hypothetical protein
MVPVPVQFGTVPMENKTRTQRVITDISETAAAMPISLVSGVFYEATVG